MSDISQETTWDVSEEQQHPWLEKRSVNLEEDIWYQQKSIDERVTWMISKTTGSLSMIDQRGMKHTYTSLDTQRLLSFLSSFQADIDREEAREQQRIDASNPPGQETSASAPKG